MNPDIRVQTTFPHHHKTKKLRRKLGGDGVVALLFLWIFAAENRPDGVLVGMDPVDIAIACQWDGDATSMLQALLDVGFLELVDDVYVLHDWLVNNPWAAAAPARKAKASAAAQARWDKRNNFDGPDARSIGGNAPSKETDAPGIAPSPTPSPSPIPSIKPAMRANESPSRSEVMIRECVVDHADFISKHFPMLDVAIEVELCVTKYRDQSIGVDPWLIVLRWLQNSKETADGKHRTRDNGRAEQAAAEAAGLGTSLTDEFCDSTRFGTDSV